MSKRTCFMITGGILGFFVFLFRAFSPLVGNAIFRLENPSAYTNDATAALLGFIGSSLFLVFDILVPVLWARHHVSHEDDDDSNRRYTYYAIAILSSPFLFVASSTLSSVISWGILHSAGYDISISISKAAIVGAVGSSVLLGSVGLFMALSVFSIKYAIDHTEFP